MTPPIGALNTGHQLSDVDYIRLVPYPAVNYRMNCYQVECYGLQMLHV